MISEIVVILLFLNYILSILFSWHLRSQQVVHSLDIQNSSLIRNNYSLLKIFGLILLTLILLLDNIVCHLLA